MPQLNPSPWFLILMFSWLILLTVVVPLVLTHTTPNTLSSESSLVDKTESWNWPWE